METFWYIALTLMIGIYVVLDGFDIGAGIIHLVSGRNDTERRTILNSIGPVWDGNEVWLLAGGGILFFAFPKAYASSFSGFYMPLIIVLWLLIGRAIGIELRKHIDSPLWKQFWDVIFSVSSIILAIFFGAALGNVIRGVPLQQDGYFYEPLWTTFTVVPDAGILDWFTVIMGLVSLFTLTAHGSNYIALKSEGDLQTRSRRISSIFNWLVLASSVAAIISVTAIKPQVWANYSAHSWGYISPILGLLGMLGMIIFRIAKNDLWAFLSSCGFIVFMLVSTAYGAYPNVLPSSADAQHSLTIFNSSAGEYGLSVGKYWWFIGLALAIIYFAYIFYSFRGKVKISSDDEGY
jgi:cytochrome d ubiquinol oxidase subunit II